MSTVDLTIAGLEAKPYGAIVRVNRVGTPNTGEDHQCGQGMTDGTTQWSHATWVPDSPADLILHPENAYRLHRYASTRLAFIIDSAGAIAGSISFDSFIPGGMRVNVDTVFPADFVLHVMFIMQGPFKVGLIDLFEPESFPDEIETGWTPYAIGTHSTVADVDDSAVVGPGFMQIGLAGWDDEGTLSQGSATFYTVWDAAVSAFENSLLVSTTDTCPTIDPTSQGLLDVFQIAGRTSTGFTIDGAVENESMRYIAYWAWGAERSVKVEADKMTSGTGSQSFTGMGPVEALIVAPTVAIQADTVVGPNAIGSTAVGLGFASSVDNQVSMFAGHKAAVPGGACKSGTADSLIYAEGYGAVGARLSDADLASFDEDGYTITKNTSVAAYHLRMSIATMPPPSPSEEPPDPLEYPPSLLDIGFVDGECGTPRVYSDPGDVSDSPFSIDEVDDTRIIAVSLPDGSECDESGNSCELYAIAEVFFVVSDYETASVLISWSGNARPTETPGETGVVFRGALFDPDENCRLSFILVPTESDPETDICEQAIAAMAEAGHDESAQLVFPDEGLWKLSISCVSTDLTTEAGSSVCSVTLALSGGVTFGGESA